MNDPILAVALRRLGSHLPQRQDSLSEQLDDLSTVAIRCGMYDAHTWLRQQIEQRKDCIN